MLKAIIDKLGWHQLKKDFLNYNLDTFKADLLAGLLVAAVGIPSVMAFAMLAGFNPVFGLYSFVVAAIAGTFVGVTHYIVVGPTNSVALMIASAVGALAMTGPEKLSLVLMLTFMAGVIQIVLSFLDFAKLANYISRSVVTGLLTGIAAIVVVGQLVNVLGLKVTKGGSAVSTFIKVVSSLGEANPIAFFVALITVLAVLIVKNISSKAPAYLLGMVVALAVVHFFGLETNIAMIQEVEGFFSGFSMPSFEISLVVKLFSYAFAISILGFIDMLVLPEFNKKGVVKPEVINKELCGLGVVNITSSFLGSFAVGGSFSRSFTNYEAGAKTRFSQLIAGFFVLLIVIAFKGLIGLLPMAVLGAILIVVAIEMIGWRQIKKILAAGEGFDTWIFVVTFVATIINPRLDYAIYLAILFSLVLLLKDTSKLEYSFLELDGKKIKQKKLEELKNEEKVIVDLAGDLHFNKVNELRKKLEETSQIENYLVIRMRNVNEIDMTALSEFDEFVDEIREQGGEIFFAGLSDKIKKEFDQYGLVEKLGGDYFFSKEEGVFESSKDALEEVEEEEEKK